MIFKSAFSWKIHFCQTFGNVFAISQEMKLNFCLQINIKIVLQVDVLLWVYVTRHTQNAQINKIAISLQCLKESLKDEIEFLPADKIQRFLQIHIIILGVCGQTCPIYSK